MKLISRRPAVLTLVTSLALFVAQVHHCGPRGFHQW